MRIDQLDAIILDLDGVITQTAQVHALAWKQMFDAYLQERPERAGESHEPFDLEDDYSEYVDGKPRQEGVRSFLESRGIELPDGSPDDPPGTETINGLGNRKNEIFQQLLHEQGVDVYQDAVEQVRSWRAAGLKTAIVSSSKNCVQVLEAAGMRDLCDAKVDAIDAERRQLRGKPDPDMFLEAARELGVKPSRTAVVEDSAVGVRAAVAGGFRTVVGVARDGDTEELKRRGAGCVVRSLRELEAHEPPLLGQPGHTTHSTPRSARDDEHWIAQRLQQHRAALFLDYDGTLTPIVRHPEEARLSDSMRDCLEQLAEHCTVAVVSGRDRPDVEQMVGLENVYYAGSHGFDIAGPGGVHREQEVAKACLPSLDEAEGELRDQLESIAGAWVERKRFALAVHFREVADEDIPQVQKVVVRTSDRHRDLRKSDGKKVLELQPNVPWDKGRAVLWLLSTLGLDDPSVVPIYVGDGTTDEDAFEALHDRGLGIVVGHAVSSTQAQYFLRDTDEVEAFLRSLGSGGWCLEPENRNPESAVS